MSRATSHTSGVSADIVIGVRRKYKSRMITNEMGIMPLLLMGRKSGSKLSVTSTPS